MSIEPSSVRKRATFARGGDGAVAAAHPIAVEAGLESFRRGGNAVDAAVSAQAALTVVLPHACSLGGDALALVRLPDGTIDAIHGAGAAPAIVPAPDRPGATVTVPGLVEAWSALVARHGRLGLVDDLAEALRLAAEGIAVPVSTAAAVERHRARLVDGGAGGWELLSLGAGERWVQPALAPTLEAIASDPRVFYEGPLAAAMVRAVGDHGGTLGTDHLARHTATWPEAIGTPWDDGTLVVQPPMSQGILLALAARWIERHGPGDARDHTAAEAIAAAFAHRNRIGEGTALLDEPLDVDPGRATTRWAARSYLHTAGVATADRAGMVVSSLVSVFDEFGSGVFVPAGGFVLNNRAEGFTEAPNDLRPGALPVHTLAPALHVRHDGRVTALATPGADGQVQTLLQVLLAMRFDGPDVLAALERPRWRGEGDRLLIERGHPAVEDLERRGHRLEVADHGDDRFGAVVEAGIDDDGPWAAGDERREVAAGA
ncbi:MAG TPA: gamma-glutamyltransferase [Actinomycetota bacterium]